MTVASKVAKLFNMNRLRFSVTKHPLSPEKAL